MNSMIVNVYLRKNENEREKISHKSFFSTVYFGERFIFYYKCLVEECRDDEGRYAATSSFCFAKQSDCQQFIVHFFKMTICR